MIQLLENIFRGSWSRVILTVQRVAYTLIAVAILTAIGLVPAFSGASVKTSLLISSFLWAYSGFRILNIWTYLYVAVAGEIADIAQAISPQKENETVWDSQLAATYRRYAINLWLAQTIVFLAAPLYFNLTDGGILLLPILIMLVFAMAMVSLKLISWIFRTIAVVTIIIFLLAATCSMFPQIYYIPYISSGVAKLRAGKLAGENAKTLAEIDAATESQHQNEIKKDLEKVTAWRKDKDNKGKELPNDLKQTIEAARQGLTLKAFQKKEEKEAAAKARAEEEADRKAKAEALLQAKAKAEAQAKAEAEMKAKSPAQQRPTTQTPSNAGETYRLTIKRRYESACVPEKLTGKWKVEPVEAQFQRESDRDRIPSHGQLDMMGKSQFVYFTLPGDQPGNVTITRIN